MYDDKHGCVLRIETVANDVTFFKHHRMVEQHDGRRCFKLAPVKKTVYSLLVLRHLLSAANRRYLDFLATLDDPTDGARNIERLGRSVHHRDRTFRGFNLFNGDDLAPFRRPAPRRVPHQRVDGPATPPRAQ